jgi:hypothetical protein
MSILCKAEVPFWPGSCEEPVWLKALFENTENFFRFRRSIILILYKLFLSLSKSTEEVLPSYGCNVVNFDCLFDSTFSLRSLGGTYSGYAPAIFY